MAFRLDQQRAEDVFARLIPAYRERAYPYSSPAAVLPQDPRNMPARFRSQREHALFLFHACYWMRGGILSDVAIRRLTEVFRHHRDLFRPAVARRLPSTNITTVLQLHGLNYKAAEIGRAWVINAARLHRLWGGDPIRLFDGVDTYDLALERIQNRNGQGFLGFQEKMVSMLIYFFEDAGLIRPFLYPSPVDFHALRILLAHEIIVPDDYQTTLYNKDLLAEARQLLVNYCQANRVTPAEICEAMWLLSRTLCRLHPGNTVWQEGPTNGRSTIFHARPIRWTSSQRQRYDRACRLCPVAATCVRCVTSAHYYVQGDLHADRLREEPPQTELFLHPLAPPRRG